MRCLWIIAVAAPFLLECGLAAQSKSVDPGPSVARSPECPGSVGELLGKVFHRGVNGVAIPERNLIVTLGATGNSDDTNDHGCFHLPLPARPGDLVTISVDKPGWGIRYPLDGEIWVPRDLAKVNFKVELLPIKSKLFWSDDRIEKFIRDAMELSKQVGRQEGRRQPLDLGFYIKDWAAKYGFSPQEARKQIDRWIAEVENNRADNYSQGLAAFAKQKFDQAAKQGHDSAEWYIGRLEENRKQEEQLANQDQDFKENVVRGLNLEGSAHYSAYRYQQALAAYERAHQYTTKEDSLRLWAATLNDIGDVHRMLASWGPSAESRAHLAQATADFGQILQVITQDRSPSLWATTQNNLANALIEQGTRALGEPRDKLLAQAVDAYRQALLVFTPETQPLLWARAQGNLGNAIREQAALTIGKAGDVLLAQAIGSLRKASQGFPRDELPGDWAAAQNNLGIALCDLGTRTAGEPGREMLTQAIGAYQRALQGYTQDTFSEDRGLVQINLGIALHELGNRTAGEPSQHYFAQAIASFREALPVSKSPQQLARLHSSFGRSLKSLGIRTAGEAGNQFLAQAVEASRQALLIYTPDDHLQWWAEAQSNLSLALQEQGSRTAGERGDQLLAQAADAARKALLAIARDQLPREWATAQSNLGIALMHQGRRTAGEAGSQLLTQAIAAFREGLLVQTQDQFPLERATTQINLGAAFFGLSLRSAGDPNGRLLAQAAADSFHQALLVLTSSDTPYPWRIARSNEATALFALGRNEEGAQALTDILDRDPEDRQVFLALVNNLNERLLDPKRAAALSQRWLQGHPKDSLARILYVEQLFATRAFAGCREEIATILRSSEIELTYRIALLGYSVAIDLATDVPEAQARIGEIIALATRQPAFELSLQFPGTQHFLEGNPDLPHRDMLIGLFQALEAPDRDTLLQRLRELKERQPVVPLPSHPITPPPAPPPRSNTPRTPAHTSTATSPAPSGTSPPGWRAGGI